MNLDWKSKYRRYSHYFFDLRKLVQTSKARSYAWVSLTVFTISFFLIVAIKPTLVTIAKLNKEIKDKREVSQELQKKIDSIIAAQEEFAKNVDNLQLLNEALPEKSQFPRLALFLETTANAEGVVLNSLSFGKMEIETKSSPQARKDAPNLLSFQVGVTGDYLKLKNFLKNLETSRRLIKTESVSFSQIEVEENKEISLLVSGEVYFLKGNEPMQAGLR